MGWLATGLIAGAFLFGVLVGVLVIGLCQMVEPREREDLPAQLEQDRIQTVGDVEICTSCSQAIARPFLCDAVEMRRDGGQGGPSESAWTRCPPDTTSSADGWPSGVHGRSRLPA